MVPQSALLTIHVDHHEAVVFDGEEPTFFGSVLGVATGVVDLDPVDLVAGQIETAAGQRTLLRGAGTCIGLALVAEWLAADLTAAEQAAITRAMAEEGGPSCYRGLHDMTHHDEVGPWSIHPDEEGLSPFSVAHWPRILDDTNGFIPQESTHSFHIFAYDNHWLPGTGRPGDFKSVG